MNPYTYGVAATGGSARVFVDDTLVADSATGGTGVKINDVTGRHRFRIDAVATTGSPTVTLTITPPEGSARPLVAADLHPRYANPTKTTTDDTLGVPGRVTTTKYESLATGVVEKEIVDPGGLDLVTTLSTETGLLRRPTARTLPANDPTVPDTTRPYGATVYDYYDNAETVANPCPGGGSANQGGRVKTITSPSPDGSANGRRVTTVVYDAAGRVVSSQLGSGAEGLVCSTYDVRGRVLTVVHPARTNSNVTPTVVEPARTASIVHALGGNPLVGSVTDPAGVITTKVDLLGRVLSYTDVWGKTTTSSYDQASRRTQSVGPAGTMNTAYTPAGRVKTQNLDGGDVARADYAVPSGELKSVTYPTSLLTAGNGSALAVVERHATGALSRLQWTGAASSVVGDDVVTRSQSGKVVDETIDTADADPANPNFEYDAAGRLTHAAVASHALDYAFAATGGCGAQTAAGRNTNRTSLIDNAGTPTTYCYDQADRLTSSSDVSVGTVTYDSYGNTATIGTQTLLYESGDRHTATRVGGAEIVRYGRDATGRITIRTEGGSVVRYGSAGPGNSASFTMDTANSVTERTIGLVGGVLLTKRGGLVPANDVWDLRLFGGHRG